MTSHLQEGMATNVSISEEFYYVTDFTDAYRLVPEYVVLVLQIILFIFNLIGSGLFFYVIYKFRRLQTRTNYILLNFFICTLCFSICGTLTIILGIFQTDLLPADILLSLLGGFLEASHLLALLLAIDWFLSAYCAIAFAKYQNIYKFIITATYLFAIINLVVYLSTSHKYERYVLFIIPCGIIYLLSLFLITAFNIIKKWKTPSEVAVKTSYALSTATIFFLMWLPLEIDLLSAFDGLIGYSVFDQIMVLDCGVLLGMVGFSSSIVILILLVCLDKNFKISYDYVFKSSVRQYIQPDSNDDDINLDADVP